VGVLVDVLVGVWVTVGVLVLVTEGVGVLVNVCVTFGVWVTEGVGVCVGQTKTCLSSQLLPSIIFIKILSIPENSSGIWTNIGK
jgi:hypothetical protein